MARRRTRLQWTHSSPQLPAHRLENELPRRALSQLDSFERDIDYDQYEIRNQLAQNVQLVPERVELMNWFRNQLDEMVSQGFPSWNQVFPCLNEVIKVRRLIVAA
jgi:hypothetical protein